MYKAKEGNLRKLVAVGDREGSRSKIVVCVISHEEYH